ncbi:hypothetical protein [Paenibacillus sp. FSL M7-1046]|uniref:hypothetical protein n=1 Tax=Paenibacillus sp. FSL M7-1046 TaxID=2975315 RepID=UPI0030F841E6
MHDLSGHYGLTGGPILNRHGIFEDRQEIRTLTDQYEVQNVWWEKPGCLYPFLFKLGAVPAGFAFIATPPYCAKAVNYFVNRKRTSPDRSSGERPYRAMEKASMKRSLKRP